VKSRVRALTLFLFCLCAPAAAATLTHCQLQSVCDASQYWYNDYFPSNEPAGVTPEPLPPGAGLIDATHWQSGPIDGNWIDYPGERSIFLFPNLVPSASGAPPALPGNFPGPYTNVSVYVSPNQDANAIGSNWTLGSGNIAEVSIVDPGSSNPSGAYIAVTNASCAQYYVRVVVERAEPDASAPDDAGADAGSLADASLDAPTDATSD